MRVATGGRMGIRSIVAGPAIAMLMLVAAGCHPEEEAPTSAPPSPLPTADSSRPEQPRPPRADQGGETQKVGSVDRDLDQDLAAPATAPGGTTTYFAPAGRPNAPDYNGDARSGRP